MSVYLRCTSCVEHCHRHFNVFVTNVRVDSALHPSWSIKWVAQRAKVSRESLLKTNPPNRDACNLDLYSLAQGYRKRTTSSMLRLPALRTINPLPFKTKLAVCVKSRYTSINSTEDLHVQCCTCGCRIASWRRMGLSRAWSLTWGLSS